MMSILRSLSFALTSAIHNLIPDLYNIFYTLISDRLIPKSSIQNISRNIYIIISVVMLFAGGIKLLNSIVNPDMLLDKKKGAAKTIFINFVISIILLGVIPIAFDKAYDLQYSLVGSSSDIKRTTDETGKVTTNEKNTRNSNLLTKLLLNIEIKDGQSIGQVLAGQSLLLFCYPVENAQGEVPEVLVDPFEGAVNDDIEAYVDDIAEYINRKNADGEYYIKYHPLLSPAFGLYMVYQMLLLCLDMGFRAVKLLLLEIMAPVVVCAFIFSGTEILQRWFKEVLSTYILAFAKVIAIMFTLLGLSYLDTILSPFQSIGGVFAQAFAKAAIIIGFLTLLKQLPKIINTIFGTNIQENGGGIGGRLAGMAAIGGIASSAWNSIKKNPARVVTTPLSIAGSAGAHAVGRIATGITNGRARAQQLRNQHKRFAGLRGFVSGLGTATLGNGLSMAGAVVRGARAGWQNANLQNVGREFRRYGETHLPNSTFTGRLADSATSALGFGTEHQRDDRRIQATPFTFRGRNYNEQEFKNVEDNYSNAAQLINGIRKKADEVIEHAGSSRPMTVSFAANGKTYSFTEKNYDTLKKRLEEFRSSGPKRGDFSDEDSFIKAQQEHNKYVTAFENNLVTEHDRQRDQLINDIITLGPDHAYKGRDKGDCEEISNAIKAANTALRDSGITDRTTGLSISSITGITAFNDARTAINEGINDITDSKQQRQANVNSQLSSERYATHYANEQSRNNRNSQGGNSGGNSSGGNH